MITAGEILKKKRESLGKSLNTASQETKIQKRFLVDIESNDYSEFDSAVFLTGFIKIYSQYLGLDTEKILALYRRDVPTRKISKNSKSKQTLTKGVILTPKLFITILSVLFFVLVFGYIGLQIYKFQSPPKLTITSPKDGDTVEQANIIVEGNTQIGATMEINSTYVELDPNGNFSKEITLIEGSNLITVKAKKNNNNVLETVETLKITYNKPQAPTEQDVIVKTFKIKVIVEDASSWVKLDVDGTNRLATVVEPSTKEYDLSTNFYVITGRAANTKVYVNDELLAWKSNNSSGVAEISCSISNASLVCE